MNDRKKYRFLFVSLLILGKDTAYRNLRSSIDDMDDVDATWLPIEMHPAELFARIPPISMSHPLKYGLVARSRVQALEHAGKTFDATFFNHILVTPFLKKFRKRVPSIDAMDVTPASLLRDGQPYYQNQNKKGLFSAPEIKRRLARSVFETARHLLPQSEYTRQSLISDYGIDNERITVLAPGVDLTIWRGRSSADTSGIATGTTTVLFVGGDYERKGGDIVTRAAAREEFSTWHFHIVSSGFTGSITSNVTVHRNVGPNSDALVRLYCAADIFVLPTRSDFAPTNSICEAMAMGLPVISTAVGGIDENVIDGKTGYIVPVDDEERLVQKLRTLGGDAELRLQIGSNARRMAEERFNTAVNARLIIELLKKTANER